MRNYQIRGLEGTFKSLRHPVFSIWAFLKFFGGLAELYLYLTSCFNFTQLNKKKYRCCEKYWSYCVLKFEEDQQNVYTRCYQKEMELILSTRIVQLKLWKTEVTIEKLCADLRFPVSCFWLLKCVRTFSDILCSNSRNNDWWERVSCASSTTIESVKCLKRSVAPIVAVIHSAWSLL